MVVIYKEEMTQQANLKKGMADLIGQKVLVKRTIGKSKIIEKTGIVENTYPYNFRVKFEDEIKESYTYGDVLSKTVEVSIYNGESFSPYTAPFELKTDF